MVTKTRLRELRQAQGLTTTQVASAVGVAERTVTRWESGESGIPDERKLALAEMFGVSVPWLMGWADGEDVAA